MSCLRSLTMAVAGDVAFETMGPCAAQGTKSWAGTVATIGQRYIEHHALSGYSSIEVEVEALFHDVVIPCERKST